MLQPAWVRTASVFVETGSTLGSRTAAILQELIKDAQAAFDHQLARIFVALLTPASVVVLVLGLWRLSADLGWTEAFLISTGFFSHWQVWIALSIALRLLASFLAARPPVDAEIPRDNPPVF
jgi:hypothetical protein